MGCRSQGSQPRPASRKQSARFSHSLWAHSWVPDSQGPCRRRAQLRLPHPCPLPMAWASGICGWGRWGWRMDPLHPGRCSLLGEPAGLWDREEQEEMAVPFRMWGGSKTSQREKPAPAGTQDRGGHPRPAWVPPSASLAQTQGPNNVCWMPSIQASVPRISLRFQPGVPAPSPILGSRISMGGGGGRGHHEVVAASVREAGCSTQSWGVGAPCVRLIKQ